MDNDSIFGTTSSVDDIIESIKPWLKAYSRLESPLGEQETIDKVIEFLASNARWSKDGRNNLHKVVSEKPYKGGNPDVMLLLYDVLDEESSEALTYGIRGFEALKRDPKKLVKLENPDRLVKYAADTTDSLEELVELKNTIIMEGQFINLESYWRSPNVSDFTKHLANSLLLVANEIAYRLKDIDIRDKGLLEKYGEDKFLDLHKQWNIRLEAHGAVVMAYQAKGEKTVNKEALEALAAYESLTGTYQSVSMYTKFTMGLMEAYARIKYQTDKPSTGEAPEELKAEHDWRSSFAFGRPDWDQYFRSQWFGTKEAPWEKWKRQREEAQEEAKQQKREGIEFLEKLIRDPWEAYAKELKLVGVTKEMSYEEAKRVFRRGAHARRDTFIRQDTGTPGYEAAMKETAAFIDAWNKVEILYKMNA